MASEPQSGKKVELSRLTTSGDGRRQVTLPVFLIWFVNFSTSK